MAPGIIPKQVTQYEASHLAELQANVSETVIKQALQYMGPIPEGGIVHDNACGSGALTECIMTSMSPAAPAKLHIDATDTNENFVQGTIAMAEKHGWPVSGQVMDAYNLTFPDNRFDQSFTTFVFHCLADGAKAAANIHRTLKPGGKMMAAVWTDMPHSDAVARAHRATRGVGAPLPSMISDAGYSAHQLRRAVKQGGFDEAKTELYVLDATLRITDVQRWCQLAWSYLGMPPTGWEESDEAKWDQALQVLEDSLKSGRNTTVEHGVVSVVMKAAVAVATK